MTAEESQPNGEMMEDWRRQLTRGSNSVTKKETKDTKKEPTTDENGFDYFLFRSTPRHNNWFKWKFVIVIARCPSQWYELRISLAWSFYRSLFMCTTTLNTDQYHMILCSTGRRRIVLELLLSSCYYDDATISHDDEKALIILGTTSQVISWLLLQHQYIINGGAKKRMREDLLN